MNSPLHDVLNPSSYVLSQDHYEELCIIRDKLMLMGQLAGTAQDAAEDMVLIRRASIGQLFIELGFQMRDALGSARKATVKRAERAKAH